MNIPAIRNGYSGWKLTLTKRQEEILADNSMKHQQYINFGLEGNNRSVRNRNIAPEKNHYMTMNPTPATIPLHPFATPGDYSSPETLREISDKEVRNIQLS